MHVTKTLSGTADLDLNALGGAVELSGRLEVSADVALHLIFGIDSDGFFIDAESSQDPELVVSNLQISGDVEGTGRLGFLGVESGGEFHGGQGDAEEIKRWDRRDRIAPSPDPPDIS